MAFDGSRNLVEIDEEEHVVYFDTPKLKKITGHRIGAIFGMSEFSTPFKVACELAGLYPGDKSNKYIEAGNAIEPILRKWTRAHISEIAPLLGLNGAMGVEEPAPADKCQYDHFHTNEMFGGMVDGYITCDGKRSAILEIKTASNREKWDDGQGGFTNVPDSYMMQASLYAELSNLQKIVFVVGFLEEADYRMPGKWVPTPENTCVVIKDREDMKPWMDKAEAWYKELKSSYCTPEWTDADEEVVKYIRALDRKNKKR